MEAQPLPTKAARPAGRSARGAPAEASSSQGRGGALRGPAAQGGDLREQLLLYVLGEKLQLKVGQGDLPGVLPLLKILLRRFLVICFRRSKRMGCWL